MTLINQFKEVIRTEPSTLVRLPWYYRLIKQKGVGSKRCLLWLCAPSAHPAKPAMWNIVYYAVLHLLA